jgi:peptidoglycan/LPS O-acetylase OafA/YrhL
MTSTTAIADTPYKPGAHVPVLDGLRGLAILLVLFRHTVRYMGPDNLVDQAVSSLMNIGWAGVDLFFVLSGFLITGILYDSKGGQHYFRNFYIRRALRIFPLYYGFLALLFLVLPQFYEYHGGRFGTLLENQHWYWTYMVNVLASVASTSSTPLNTTHLWSLAVEEQFYIVWPAVVLLCTRRVLVAVCAWMVVASLAVRMALIYADGGGNDAAYMLMPARMDTLALGALLALLARDSGGLPRLMRWARWGAVLSGGIIALLIGANLGLKQYDVTTQTVGYTGIAVLATCVLALVLDARPGSRTYRAFDQGWLRALGKYSYAIYLFHYPLLNYFRYVYRMREVPELLGSAIPAQFALTLTVSVASFVLAWLSWHLYEKHFLKLKRFFPNATGSAGNSGSTGGTGVPAPSWPAGSPERALRVR